MAITAAPRTTTPRPTQTQGLVPLSAVGGAASVVVGEALGVGVALALATNGATLAMMRMGYSASLMGTLPVQEVSCFRFTVTKYLPASAMLLYFAAASPTA